MGRKRNNKFVDKHIQDLEENSVCDECELKRERNQAREFWRQLSPHKQQALCQVDKSFVLKELRTQHKHACSCPTCGKRRTMFDSEVKVFEEYIHELECAGTRDRCGHDVDSVGCNKRIPRDDFPFGNYLIIRDSKITLSQDYFSDCGRRFSEIMEHCGDLYPEDDHTNLNQYPYPSDFHDFSSKARRHYRHDKPLPPGTGLEYDTEDESEGSTEEDGCSQSDEEDGSQGEEDVSDLDDEDEEDEASQHSCHGNGRSSNSRKMQEYRIQETRLFFQVYVARLFTHNVKVAYKEVVARANQMTLLADLEREDQARLQRDKKGRQEKKKDNAKSRKGEDHDGDQTARSEKNKDRGKEKEKEKDGGCNGKVRSVVDKKDKAAKEAEKEKEDEEARLERERREEQRRRDKERKEAEKRKKELAEKEKERMLKKQEKTLQKKMQEQAKKEKQVEPPKEKKKEDRKDKGKDNKSEEINNQSSHHAHSPPQNASNHSPSENPHKNSHESHPPASQKQSQSQPHPPTPQHQRQQQQQQQQQQSKKEQQQQAQQQHQQQQQQQQQHQQPQQAQPSPQQPQTSAKSAPPANTPSPSAPTTETVAKPKPAAQPKQPARAAKAAANPPNPPEPTTAITSTTPTPTVVVKPTPQKAPAPAPPVAPPPATQEPPPRKTSTGAQPSTSSPASATTNSAPAPAAAISVGILGNGGPPHPPPPVIPPLNQTSSFPPLTPSPQTVAAAWGTATTTVPNGVPKGPILPFPSPAPEPSVNTNLDVDLESLLSSLVPVTESTAGGQPQPQTQQPPRPRTPPAVHQPALLPTQPPYSQPFPTSAPTPSLPNPNVPVGIFPSPQPKPLPTVASPPPPPPPPNGLPAGLLPTPPPVPTTASQVGAPISPTDAMQGYLNTLVGTSPMSPESALMFALPGGLMSPVPVFGASPIHLQQLQQYQQQAMFQPPVPHLQAPPPQPLPSAAPQLRIPQQFMHHQHTPAAPNPRPTTQAPTFNAWTAVPNPSNGSFSTAATASSTSASVKGSTVGGQPPFESFGFGPFGMVSPLPGSSSITLQRRTPAPPAPKSPPLTAASLSSSAPSTSFFGLTPTSNPFQLGPSASSQQPLSTTAPVAPSKPPPPKSSPSAEQQQQQNALGAFANAMGGNGFAAGGLGGLESLCGAFFSLPHPDPPKGSFGEAPQSPFDLGFSLDLSRALNAE